MKDADKIGMFICLAIIVACQLVQTLKVSTPKQDNKMISGGEEVAEVIGTTWTDFDGLGASCGLLIKTSHGLELISLNDYPTSEKVTPPRYITMVKWESGQTSYAPLHLYEPTN